MLNLRLALQHQVIYQLIKTPILCFYYEFLKVTGLTVLFRILPFVVNTTPVVNLGRCDANEGDVLTSRNLHSKAADRQ